MSGNCKEDVKYHCSLLNLVINRLLNVVLCSVSLMGLSDEEAFMGRLTPVNSSSDFDAGQSVPYYENPANYLRDIAIRCGTKVIKYLNYSHFVLIVLCASYISP